MIIAADGRMTGRKNADFTSGICAANFAIANAIRRDRTIVSGTDSAVKRSVFLMARRKYLLPNSMTKLFSPANFPVKAFSVKA